MSPSSTVKPLSIIEFEPWRGMQIASVPPHIQEEYANERGEMPHFRMYALWKEGEIEAGFVMSWDGTGAWCRFYYPNGLLRTKANSEKANLADLYPFLHSPQNKIDTEIQQLEAEWK
jgi:hypothetical protein